MSVDLDSPTTPGRIRPALKRSCRWVGPTAANDLAHGAPAGLRVENLELVEFWAVCPVEGGYALRLERSSGDSRKMCRIDTTFGREAWQWECSCCCFRGVQVRRDRPGCLHVKVLHAALSRLGSADTKE